MNFSNHYELALRISDHVFLRLKARAPHLTRCRELASKFRISVLEFLGVCACAPQLGSWFDEHMPSDYELVLSISDYGFISGGATSLTSDLSMSLSSASQTNILRAFALRLRL